MLPETSNNVIPTPTELTCHLCMETMPGWDQYIYRNGGRWWGGGRRTGGGGLGASEHPPHFLKPSDFIVLKHGSCLWNENPPAGTWAMKSNRLFWKKKKTTRTNSPKHTSNGMFYSATGDSQRLCGVDYRRALSWEDCVTSPVRSGEQSSDF